MGVSRVAEQHRSLGAQAQDATDGLIVVVCVALVAAADKRPPDTLPQVASRRVLEKRLDARARVEYRSLRSDAARPGRGGEQGAFRLWQAFEIGLTIECKMVVVFVREQILRKGGVERGELLVQLRQRGLGTPVEPGACVHETRMYDPRKPPLFGVEAQPLARFVDRCDAPEQPFVLDDSIGVRRENRCDVALEPLHGGVVQRRGVHPEQADHPGERPTRSLERGQRVAKGRRVRFRGDRLDLCQFLGHCREQRRFEIRKPDTVERWQPAVRADPGEQQRIRLRGRGGSDVGHRCGGVL